jgi:hypothetical protein
MWEALKAKGLPTTLMMYKVRHCCCCCCTAFTVTIYNMCAGQCICTAQVYCCLAVTRSGAAKHWTNFHCIRHAVIVHAWFLLPHLRRQTKQVHDCCLWWVAACSALIAG